MLDDESTNKSHTLAASINSGPPHRPELRAFLDDLFAYRARAVEAVADFYQRVSDGEDDAELRRAWNHAGYATFEDVLRKNNVCDLACYAAFKAAVAEFGFDRVKLLGVSQTALMLQVPNDECSREVPTKNAREAVLDDVIASRERTGAPASPRQVQSIAQKHFVRSRVDKVKPTTDERVAELEAKNVELRKEVARLTREVERWKKSADRSQKNAPSVPARSSKKGSAK